MIVTKAASEKSKYLVDAQSRSIQSMVNENPRRCWYWSPVRV